MDYFIKWPEFHAIPNQVASIVVEAVVTNFFCRFRVPRELIVTRAVISSPV
jgi:hypothetical protein